MLLRSILFLAAVMIFAGSTPVQAEEACNCPHGKASTESMNYLAVQMPTLSVAKSLGDSDKHMVASYIQGQLTANGISASQFLALTVDQQRQVLKPGRQFLVTRESRRTIIPFKRSLPSDVESMIKPGAMLTANTVSDYGVVLPDSVSASLPSLASGYRRVILGSTLVLLDAKQTIVDVIPNIL